MSVFMAKVLEMLKSCSWISSGMVTGFETNCECLLKDSVGKAKEKVVQKGFSANAGVGMIKCSWEETQNLRKCFGISFCLISLCTVYTFNRQNIVRGAICYSVLLQRRALLLWRVVYLSEHTLLFSTNIGNSRIQDTSGKLIEENEGKPYLWYCYICLRLSNTLFWNIPTGL